MLELVETIFFSLPIRGILDFSFKRLSALAAWRPEVIPQVIYDDSVRWPSSAVILLRSHFNKCCVTQDYIVINISVIKVPPSRRFISKSIMCESLKDYLNHWFIYGTSVLYPLDQPPSAKNIKSIEFIGAWLAICINTFVTFTIEI